MSTIHDAQADRLDALIAIPGHAFVEHADEFVHGDTREVSFMKEILLESAEEVLRCRVIWAVSPLRAHRMRQIMLPADTDPFKPPIAATTHVNICSFQGY